MSVREEDVGPRQSEPVPHFITNDNGTNKLLFYFVPVEHLMVSQHYVVRSRNTEEPHFISHIAQMLRSCALNHFLKFTSSSASNAPRMPRENRSRRFCNANELTCRTRGVNLANDGSPYESVRRITRCGRLSFDPHHRAHGIADRRSMAPE